MTSEDREPIAAPPGDHHELIGVMEVRSTSADEEAQSNAGEGNEVLSQSILRLPERLHNVAKTIHELQHDDLIAITEMANQVTLREVYGVQDTSPWYVPEVRLVGDSEPTWRIQTVPDRLTVMITMFGREVRVPPVWWSFLVAMLALAWYVVYNVLGPTLTTRGGYLWDPIVMVVVASIVGGTMCKLLQLPALLGILWMGILWNNIPELKYLTSGIYKDVSKISLQLGLVVVLSRAGFALSLKVIRPHMRQSILLATIPFAVEATVHAVMAQALFNFDSYTWSFLEGCMCSIVSPAIIVVEIIKLQDQGYGRGQGPLTLLLSAVGIEVCAGVWAVSFIVDLLFSNGSLAKQIVLGPVQLIVGGILGVCVGRCFCFGVDFIKKLGPRISTGDLDHRYVESVINFAYAFFLLLNTGFVFFGSNHKLSGGGSVTVVAFSATVAHIWPAGEATYAKERKLFAHYLSVTWDSIIVPILFAMVGAGIAVQDMFNASFTPKALAICGASTAARMAVIYVTQLGVPYNWKQRLVVCGGYAGKATAQAALAPVALNAVRALILQEGETDELLEKKRIAEIVASVAQFYIIVTVPLCTLTVSKWGTRVLPRVIDA